jgi:penicillin-binding protein 2
MGLGELTGIDVPGEVGGVIAGPSQKEKTSGERWYLGNTYQMAIGQGDTLVTPLQLNLMTNVIASAGVKCKPHLAQYTGGEKCPTVEISKEVLDIIRKGMTGACSPGGTAFPLFDWNEAALRDSGSGTFAKSAEGQTLPVIACKTGTAEYVAADGKIRTHGWLTAFAPADDPQISVTVVVEGGGEGSNVAAPIVRKILAKYFNIKDTYPYGAIRQELGE